MRQIKERALFARAKRQVWKDEELVLHKHKKGNADYVLNGDLYAYAVNPYNNTLMWYVDLSDYLDHCREKGVLKEGEELA